MLILCRVVELVSQAIIGVADPDEFESAVFDHLRLHQVAYGTRCWKPKFVHSKHLPKMYRNKKRLYACFTHERKHKEPKWFAWNRTNTRNQEIGLLEELTDQHLWSLGKPLAPSTMKDARAAYQRMSNAVRSELGAVGNTVVMTSPAVYVRARAVYARDVVMLTDRCVAEVWFFASMNDAVFACVSRWPTARVESSASLAVRIRDAPELVHISLLVGSLVYRRHADLGFATVLLPLR